MKIKRASWLLSGAKFVMAGSLLLLLVAATRSQASAAAGKVIISGFPLVEQSYSLSCEYASAMAVTLYWGDVVTEKEFMAAIPTNPNPHLGFRGNIYAAWGGTTNYGIYAEPLVPVLAANGYNAEVFYGGVARLKAEIAAGHPVVVWYAGTSDDVTATYQTYQGQTFKLVPYEHAAVVYGYDNGGVWIMNVGTGQPRYYTWSDFLQRWDYFDEMALVITPA